MPEFDRHQQTSTDAPIFKLELYGHLRFRSMVCNQQAGGASNSQHLYGMAADVVGGGVLLCAIAQAARSAGFSGTLGPGAPAPGNHVHLDSRVENHSDGLVDGWYWSAPTCGIASASTLQTPYV